MRLAGAKREQTAKRRDGKANGTERARDNTEFTVPLSQSWNTRSGTQK